MIIKKSLKVWKPDVKKLQFGVDSHRHLPAATTTTTTTTTVKPKIDVITTTAAPESEEEEQSSEFESALEQQLRRVANLANRFKNNKPILVNTRKQTIKSKLPLKVAEKFPVLLAALLLNCITQHIATAPVIAKILHPDKKQLLLTFVSCRSLNFNQYCKWFNV